MARTAPGVVPKLILPNPPEKYSREDQIALRRILQEAGSVPPDFSTLITVPQPVKDLSTIPTITAYMLTLLGATSAANARALLDIKMHRSAQALTTASLANNAVEHGSVAMPDTAVALLTIAADRVCWVRLYATDAARVNDISRTLGTLATAGQGVLAEFVYDVTMTFPFTISCSPVPWLSNDDGSPSSVVYYSIQNLSGATHTVAVTLGYGALP